MAESKDPLSSPDLLTSIFTSKADANIQRISKLLSTSSGVDATLTLVGYGLFFVGSQVEKLEKLNLKALSHLSSDAAFKAGAKSAFTLADIASSSKVLAGMCSDFRTFTRLWGLLGVYGLAKRQYLAPPKDTVLRVVGSAQTLALGAYYVYENGYYLAGKGVLKGWTVEKITRWAKTSLKLFLVYVLIDFVRLWRVRQLRNERKASLLESDQKGTREIKAEENAWMKTALVDAAYTPLSVHWSSDTWKLSDGSVGALMSLIGLIKVRTAWAATA